MPFTPVLTFRTDACDRLVGINTEKRNALTVSLTSPGHPPGRWASLVILIVGHEELRTGFEWEAVSSVCGIFMCLLYGSNYEGIT